MTELRYESPLIWPPHVSETPLKSRGLNSGFKQDLTVAEAVAMLEEEITAFGCERAVLFTDYEQIKIDRLRRRQGDHPGALLEIRYKAKPYVFACDRWKLIEQNIYALHLIIRNYRLMEKWGVADITKLMAGFAASRTVTTTASEAGVAQEEWMQTLGLGPSATVDDAHAVYRSRAKRAANDADQLIVLNNAMDEARKKLGE